LREHSLKVVKRSVRLSIGKYFFSSRVINEWYAPRKEIINGSLFLKAAERVYILLSPRALRIFKFKFKIKFSLAIYREEAAPH